MIKNKQIRGLCAVVLLGLSAAASLAHESGPNVDLSPRFVWEKDWTVVTLARNGSWG
jgi:hypothetical protein